jgi:AraC-like DNA-binding protein
MNTRVSIISDNTATKEHFTMYERVILADEIIFKPRTITLTEHEVHTHDALEISVLLENEARYHLTDRDYDGKPGDVFVFRPFEPHYNLIRDSSKPAHWIMILFSPTAIRWFPEGYKLLTPFYTMERFTPLLDGGNPYAQQIHAAAKLAVEEQSRQLPGWRTKQVGLLIDILTSIYRAFLAQRQSVNETSEPDSTPSPGILNVIPYLLQHFQEDIDVQDVIRMSGLNKTWFYTKFRETTALSPQDFIHQLRMQHASHLLRYSDRTITEIAFECGFHSLSYFNKLFKQMREISPSEYRKKNQPAPTSRR